MARTKQTARKSTAQMPGKQKEKNPANSNILNNKLHMDNWMKKFAQKNNYDLTNPSDYNLARTAYYDAHPQKIKRYLPPMLNRQNRKFLQQLKEYHGLHGSDPNNGYLARGQKFQNPKLSIPLAHMRGSIKQTLQNLGLNKIDGKDVRLQESAVKAIQTSAQQYLTELYKDAYISTLLNKRKSLTRRDLRLAMRLRRDKLFTPSKDSVANATQDGAIRSGVMRIFQNPQDFLHFQGFENKDFYGRGPDKVQHARVNN